MADALDEYLNAWFSQLSLDLKKNESKKSRSKNKNSNLSESIKPFYTRGYDYIKCGISINDYYVFVDGGRKSGNVAASVDLKNWAKRKGIDPRKKLEAAREAYRDKHVKKKRVAKLKPMSYNAAAKSFEFMVKRKLQNKGYEGNNFYSEIVTQAKFDQLQKTVSQLFQKNINIELSK